MLIILKQYRDGHIPIAFALHTLEKRFNIAPIYNMRYVPCHNLSKKQTKVQMLHINIVLISGFQHLLEPFGFSLFLLGPTLCEEFLVTKSRPVPVGHCFQLVKIVVGDNEDDDVDRGTILQLFNAFLLVHRATRGIARKIHQGGILTKGYVVLSSGRNNKI